MAKNTIFNGVFFLFLFLEFPGALQEVKVTESVICLSLNRCERRALTVQADVVTLTPVAPQWRIDQAGAANLDGVVQPGLQIHGQPGFSKCRRHLERAERGPLNTSAHAQAHIKHIKPGRMVGRVAA